MSAACRRGSAGSTPGPTADTMPAASWPMIIGYVAVPAKVAVDIRAAHRAGPDREQHLAVPGSGSGTREHEHVAIRELAALIGCLRPGCGLLGAPRAGRGAGRANAASRSNVAAARERRSWYTSNDPS